MPRFIELTTMYDVRVLVNTDSIATIEPMGNCSLVQLNGPRTDMLVKEKAAEIVSMIKEVTKCRTCSRQRT